MQTGKSKCSTFLSQSRILKIGRQYRIRFYANRTHTQKKTEQKMSKGEKNGNINKWCASTGSVFYCYTQVRFVYTSPERSFVIGMPHPLCIGACPTISLLHKNFIPHNLAVVQRFYTLNENIHLNR